MPKKKNCPAASINTDRYFLRSTPIFLKQFDHLAEETKQRLAKKIFLIEINPYRHKAIKGHKIPLFRIRFSDNRKEKRLIYTVAGQYISLLCVLDRSNDYADLRLYLKRVGYLRK